MTVSDVDAGVWKPVPGAGYYEASDRGQIRSVERTINGRTYPQTVLQPRRDGDGYLVVNITYDNRERKHGVSVARLVLLAHAGEPPQPDMQACHGPGGQRDNRYPENLRWDTDEANRADWRHDNPPKPKPLKQCVRCSKPFDGNGRRCHPCVMEIGQRAADYLAEGGDLEAVAQALDYPSPVGLFRLAKRYGGLRCVIATQSRAPEPPVRHPPSRLRRVLFRWEASRRNSDAQ